MHVAIVGNCQINGFADVARILAPDVSFDTVDYLRLGRPEEEERLLSLVAGADLILRQPFDPPTAPAMSSAWAAAQAKAIIWSPFGFEGFHPDCFYITGPDGRWLRSPMDDYNSLLIATGFVAGLSPARTAGLFNALSYARMGYFDAFPRAREITTRWFEPYGFDVASAFDQWLAGGPFMHTVNHPKIAVLDTLARHTLQRAGIATRGYDGPLPQDGLRHCVWPVYPELARRIGVEGGGLEFLNVQPYTEPAPLSLAQMVEGSFEVYAALPPSLLGSDPRILRALEALGLKPSSAHVASAA